MTINSAEEQASFNSHYASGWLYGTDAGSEGTWRWLTGEPFTYTHWAPGSPDNGGLWGQQTGNPEDLLAAKGGGGGWWDDQRDWVGPDKDPNVYPFTCEYELPDPLAENQVRLDQAIAAEDVESIVDAIVFAFDYLDDARAQPQIDQGRTAYAVIMDDRISFARDNGTAADIEWIMGCQSLLLGGDPPVMGGGGQTGAYGYLWDACDEALTAILLREIEAALAAHDLERILMARVLAETGVLSDESSVLVLDAAQKATNKYVTRELTWALISPVDFAGLCEATAMCQSGICTFGPLPEPNAPEPDYVPTPLYDQAMNAIQEMLAQATLCVTVLSPVDVCVTDPLGRRAGTLGGETFAEIPGAYYTGPGTTPEHVEVPLTEAGTYKVDLTGTGEGPYHLVIAGLGLPDGHSVATYEGTAEPGAAYSYDFEMPAAYKWTGFFSPVDNAPTLNVAKAGSAIPVKFSLSGDMGLAIFAPGYPKSGAMPSTGTGVQDVIEQTVTAGASSLRYDASVDQYIYVWKTDKAWAGTCRALEVKLIDGSSHLAYFRFTK